MLLCGVHERWVSPQRRCTCTGLNGGQCPLLSSLFVCCPSLLKWPSKGWSFTVLNVTRTSTSISTLLWRSNEYRTLKKQHGENGSFYRIVLLNIDFILEKELDCGVCRANGMVTTMVQLPVFFQKRFEDLGVWALPSPKEHSTLRWSIMAVHPMPLRLYNGTRWTQATLRRNRDAGCYIFYFIQLFVYTCFSSCR